MIRTRLLTSLSVIAVLSLAACAPVIPAAPLAPRVTEPSPHPSTPVVDFAATVDLADALLLDYWDAVDEVYRSKGERLDALEKVAIAETVQEERAVAQLHGEAGVTMMPLYTASATQFERLFFDRGALYLVVTTCVDSSDVRLVDAAGDERLLDQQASRTVNEITIEIGDPAAFTDLRVARWSVWTNTEC